MFDSSNPFWLVVSNICYFFHFIGLSSFPLTISYFSRCFFSPPPPTSNPFIGQSLPSGKRLHHYGKSPCLNGKIHYFYGHFQWQSLFFLTLISWTNLMHHRKMWSPAVLPRSMTSRRRRPKHRRTQMKIPRMGQRNLASQGWLKAKENHGMFTLW